MLSLLQRAILYPGSPMHAHPDAGEDIVGLERLSVAVHGERVEAWFIPGRGVSPDAPGPLVIFAHGNGELIDQWPEPLSPWIDRGVSLLLPEYRGYGRSGGRPTQQGIVEDFERFYDLAVARPDVDPSRVILQGRSLGGGVVGALFPRRPARAVILMSTFTSIPDVASRWLIPRFVVLDRWETLPAVQASELPFLIVHGTEDRLIPVGHARRLHEAARRSELVLYEGGHNDTPPDWRAFWSDIDAFIERHDLLP